VAKADIKVNYSMIENRIVDPLTFQDWNVLVTSFKEHTAFHSSGWLKVLKETYRYNVFAVLLYQENICIAVLPVAIVGSLVTGKRGVSLPFSDFVFPLSNGNSELIDVACRKVLHIGRETGWKYFELRGARLLQGFEPNDVYYHHHIDLHRSVKELLESLSSSKRRNIKKSERSGINVAFSETFSSMKSFYKLNCITRKKHGLPPQPLSFFRNIHKEMISRGAGSIVEAWYNGKVIAAFVLLYFGRRAIYKYGASSERHLSLRPNDRLMWETIVYCKKLGYECLSLGRTKPKNSGLDKYKRDWGSAIDEVVNTRFSFVEGAKKTGSRSFDGTKLLTKMPIWFLRIVGKLIYRHVG
jgi:hypothetical protein